MHVSYLIYGRKAFPRRKSSPARRNVVESGDGVQAEPLLLQQCLREHQAQRLGTNACHLVGCAQGVEVDFAVRSDRHPRADPHHDEKYVGPVAVGAQ